MTPSQDRSQSKITTMTGTQTFSWAETRGQEIYGNQPQSQLGLGHTQSQHRMDRLSDVTDVTCSITPRPLPTVIHNACREGWIDII